MEGFSNRILSSIAGLALLAGGALPLRAGNPVDFALGNTSTKPWHLRIVEGSTGKLVVTDLKTRESLVLEKEHDLCVIQPEVTLELDFQAAPGTAGYQIQFALMDDTQVDNLVTWVAADAKVRMVERPSVAVSSPLQILAGNHLVIFQDVWQAPAKTKAAPPMTLNLAEMEHAGS